MRLDTSTSARIFSAIEVGTQFLNHPFFGYGITGYWFIDGQFVRTLIETGLAGLFSLVWLLVATYRVIGQTNRLVTSPRLKAMMVGFHAGFWGLVVHAVTANTFMIVRIAEPFWCLTGLTVVTLLLAQKEQQSDGDVAVPSTT
jgi:O-antigen ligase